MMKRVFTAWRSLDGKQTSVVSGEGPPRFANGELEPNCEVKLWRIEVGSFEEAMAIRNLRLGYGPYVPEGEAAPCPRCGSMCYPEHSGQCWNCDFEGNAHVPG
jgi:hypothetical protein